MTRTLLFTGALCAVLLIATPDSHARGTRSLIEQAVADPARPDSDRARDADRKPAESLKFAGVRPGAQVVELIPGSGYFTRLLSVAVGTRGKVYAVAPPRRPNAAPESRDPAAAVQAIAADPHYANVTVLVQHPREYSLPKGVDLVWTSQNYHDFHNIPDIQVVDIDKAVFDALKPGGVYLVLDHAAEAGSGFRDTSTLHRIDPEAVKKEVESVGFKLEAESNVLHNANDAHTAKVFDAAIRGHTDQFILKFTKPK